MTADVLNFPRPRLRIVPALQAEIYHHVLVRGDVSIGDLAHALRSSGLAITTDAEGRNVLHRRPTPPEAA